MSVNFYNIGMVEDCKLGFAVICAKFNNQWIFAQHKERDTWEIPGGYREDGEAIIETARRELFEETGALQFELESVSDFSIEINSVQYGRLFYAEVQKIGNLPPLEIGKIAYFTELPDRLTYPHTQPYLYERIIAFKEF